MGVWGWIGRVACRETVMGGEIVSREEGKEDERECGSGSGSFFLQPLEVYSTPQVGFRPRG